MPRTNTSQRLRADRRRTLWLSIAGVIGVVLIFGGLVLSSHLAKLDEQITARFAGVRWALPAQVYAAPLELYPGQRIERAGLKHELERLGYRPATRLEGPGTFVLEATSAQIHSRDFNFWDGAQPAQRVSVRLSEGIVEGVTDLGSGESRVLFRLDPLLIGSIYPQQGEDRVLVRLDEVPALLKDGLIAVEDQAFYQHLGISIKGIFRAALANFQAGKVVQGASTITQQLVKNFFLTSARNWERKITEMLMALLLERHYGKDEILEAYINEIYLGQDGNRAVHGFGLASQFYFNKPLAELRTHEIALLIGVVKGASHFNPRRHPERVKARRDLVLGVFHEQGLIDEAEHQAAMAEPLGLAGSPQGGVERYPAFVDLVKRQLRGQYAEADLTDEGLRIFTTLEPRAQEALERNVSQGLDELETARKMDSGSLESAGVITNVNSGDILAMVGSRKTRFAGFNRALDSKRSIGSLVKPFVYLTALEQPARYNLHTLLEDQPIELVLPTRQVWSPKNYDHKLHGPQPLYAALMRSYNLPTVRVGLDLGEASVLDTLKRAGYTGDATPLPSLFLGAIDIAPIEVAQMYGTLAAGGFRSPVSAIREVLTKEGEPLSRYPLKVEQALPEDPVYLTTWALTQALRRGTGATAYQVVPNSTELAGKTGTTDDLRDSWFAGFGGDRVAVVWVGRDDYQPMGLTGSTGALHIWARLIRDLDERSLDLIPPANIQEQLADRVTGLKADQGCADAVLIPYIRGYAPMEYAPCAEASVPQPLKWLREIFG